MNSSLRSWLLRSWWQLALLGLAAITVFTYWNSQRRADARAEARAEQERRAYTAKRRGDCYDIYAKERGRFNNVEGLEYDPDDDLCRVRYKRNAPDSSCGRFASIADSVHFPLLDRRREDCATQTFSNEF